MQKFVLSIILAAIAAAVYSEHRHADYIWNDPVEILATDDAAASAELARKVWRPNAKEVYAPLAPTVWALVKASPVGEDRGAQTFHALSLIVHVASAVFVFSILCLLTQTPAASFVGATLFAVHPLQIESVAYIGAFNLVLGGAFALLTIWQYLNYALAAREARGKRKARRALFVATGTFVLALLSTPAAAIAPALAWLLEKLLPKRTSLIGGYGSRWPLVMWAVFATLPVIWAINSQNTQALATGVPWWSRPLVAADAISFYLSKVFVPILIGPDYGRSPSFLIAHWWGYVTWLIPLILLLVLNYSHSKARSWYTVALGLFVFALTPFLGLILFEDQATSTVANRFAYLAMLGAALAAAYTVAMPRRSWLPAAVIAATIGFGFVTRHNLQHWQSAATLWRHAVEVNPLSPIAHEVLGHNFRRNGDWENARIHYRKVIEVNAVSPEIHFYLGEIEREHGELASAIELYRKTLHLDPTHAAAHGRVGLALAAAGEQDAAMTHLTRAVELAPDEAEPLRTLGQIHVERKQHAEAIPYLTRALRLSDRLAPADQAEIHALMGLAMAATQQTEIAREHLEKSLSLAPDHKAAHRTLGDIYFAEGAYAAARPHYERVVDDAGNDLNLYLNLGTILLEAKDYRKAVALFVKVIELQPNSPVALNKAGLAYFQLRQFNDAESSFKKALDLDPSLADAHYFLGDIARWRGREPEALAGYYRALKLEPTHADANYRLGHYFLKKQDPTQAIRHFRAALGVAPNDPRLIYSLKKAERVQEEDSKQRM